MGKAWQELKVRVGGCSLPCVLDPALALGAPQGAALALRLTRVLEPWLTRSFWQLVDASELLVLGGEGDAPDVQALAAWIALRDRTDAGSWPLRWVGDHLGESQVHDAAAAAGLLERYESLLEGLAQRAPAADGRWHCSLHSDAAGCDTLALSASLLAAPVLTQLPVPAPRQGAGTSPAAPWLVAVGQTRGLRIEQADTQGNLLAAERELLCDALAQAGLAPLAQPLRLAVVHMLTQDAGLAAGALPGAAAWDGAQGWWYAL